MTKGQQTATMMSLALALPAAFRQELVDPLWACFAVVLLQLVVGFWPIRQERLRDSSGDLEKVAAGAVFVVAAVAWLLSERSRLTVPAVFLPCAAAYVGTRWWRLRRERVPTRA